MKKSLLVITVFLFAPLMAVAQTPTKSRIETEIEQLGMKSVSFKIASASKAPLAAASAEPKIKVTSSHRDVSIIPNTRVDTNVMITDTITNLLSQPLPVGFVRVQNLPPMWKTSVCFGTNCYVDRVSGVDSAAIPWEPNEGRDLVLHVRTPPGAQGVGNIELTLFPTYSTDSIKITYTVTMEPVPVTDCRTFWFANPFNGEVTLKSFGIENPELFDIELISDTEYPTSPGEPFQVRFCLKKTDGEMHSTKITFVTDSGSFEGNITMEALPSSVRPSDRNNGVHILSVSPNPASSSHDIEINLESERAANMSLTIVDLLGHEIRTAALTTGTGSSSVKMDLNHLSAGSYILLLKENGQIIDQASFNVTR
jgi:hypothetical protein